MGADALWKSLEATSQFGGSQRIKGLETADLYCSLDAGGRRGLVLVSDKAPEMPPPAFGALDISVGLRVDRRYAFALWLRVQSLSPVFTLLCDDLIDSVSDVNPPEVLGVLLSRLIRWRRLLESGEPNRLSASELRGLAAELMILRQCLSVYAAPEVIGSWRGPLGAPQDFALPGKVVEVKALSPGARSIQISSAEQLDISSGRSLELAIVDLSSVGPETNGSFSVPGIVSEIEGCLEDHPVAAREFQSLLAAYGYMHIPEYDALFFRSDGIRSYLVCDGFPRIIRRDLLRGIRDVQYQIEIALIAQFEKPFVV